MLVGKSLLGIVIDVFIFQSGRRGHKRRNKPRKNPHDLDDARLQDLGFDLPATAARATDTTASKNQEMNGEQRRETPFGRWSDGRTLPHLESRKKDSVFIPLY